MLGVDGVEFWESKTLPSVFRFELFPSLRLKDGSETMAFAGFLRANPRLGCCLKASRKTRLPSDSMLVVVEGENEVMEFGWEFDRWKEFVEWWENTP